MNTIQDVKMLKNIICFQIMQARYLKLYNLYTLSFLNLNNIDAGILYLSNIYLSILAEYMLGSGDALQF